MTTTNGDISGSVSQIDVYDTANRATALETMTFSTAYAMTSAVKLDYLSVLGTGTVVYGSASGGDVFLHGYSGGETFVGTGGHNTFVISGVLTNYLTLTTAPIMTGDVITGGSGDVITGGSGDNALAFVGVKYAGTWYDARGATITGIDVVLAQGLDQISIDQSQIASNTTFVSSYLGTGLYLYDTVQNGPSVMDGTAYTFLQSDAAGNLSVGWNTTYSYFISQLSPYIWFNASGATGDVWMNAPGHVSSVLVANNGNDVLNGNATGSGVIFAGAGNDVIDGKSTFFLDYGSLKSGITATFSGGNGNVVKANGKTDTIANVTFIYGTTSADTFIDTQGGVDTFDGGGGAGIDTLDLSSCTVDTLVFSTRRDVSVWAEPDQRQPCGVHKCLADRQYQARIWQRYHRFEHKSAKSRIYRRRGRLQPTALRQRLHRQFGARRK